MGLVAATGCAVVALSGHWGVLMLGRALIGFGFSAAVMGGFKLFAAWVSEDATTSITGRYLFFGMLGGLLATTPLTLMLEEYGWRTVFVLFSTGTAAYSVVPAASAAGITAGGCAAGGCAAANAAAAGARARAVFLRARDERTSCVATTDALFLRLARACASPSGTPPPAVGRGSQ